MNEQEEFEFRLRLERESQQPERAPTSRLGRLMSPDGQKLLKGEALAFLSPLRGVKDVIDTGAELLATGYDKIAGNNLSSLVTGGEGARVRAMNDAGKAEFDAATKGSAVAPVGRLVGNVVGTAPLVSAIGVGAGALGATRLGSAIASSGMTTGAAPAAGLAARAGDLGIRSAGGAISGLLSAGAVNPDDAITGAAIGGALPGVTKAAGAVGRSIGSAVNPGRVAPEVAALAQRAKDLGIDIPADRLVNSKPLNALASGLNYVPFSGRAATESKMEKQLTRAATRLIGQDSDNMMASLRKASEDLGSKFDSTLRSTGVAFDQDLLRGISDVYNRAQRELGADSLKAISSQVDELVEKGATGVIDGQAAYNIKRTLDRIGRHNGPEAFHALELKGVLMEALNRSLGPEKAAAFATTRQQYGNMLALEKIAKNGVEGEISVARLANLPNINNEPLQELADIAAQFVKAREGQHGAMQRGAAALGIGGSLGLPALAGVSAGGRATNALLNSDAVRNRLLSEVSTPGAMRNFLAGPEAQQLLYRSAPLAGTR